MWADHILLRLADLIGLQKVQDCLRREVRIYSLFAGMDCQRFAWAFLPAACKRLWDFYPAVTFDLILWALPKGTVQRGLGWGGGRGSGRKEKEEDFEKKRNKQNQTSLSFSL